ncbi:MAG: 50S ribosomal protein L24 [Gemmatimonadota bacterium]
MRIRKGDLVQMISGKDRGKQGKVLEAVPKERRVIVENANLVKEHRRPRPMKSPSRMGQTQVQPGGIFEIASAVPVSNVMLVCPACRRATRVGYELRESKDGVTKARVCKRADCGEVVDR